VRIDVTPEPSPDELAAIRIALERLANAEPAAAFRRRLWTARAELGRPSWRETARFESVDDGV